MNLTNSQYNQLLVHYTEQRGRAMDERDERRAEVYGRIPELADVDSQARKLSIAFVREGGTNEGKNGKAYRQKMEELKRKRIRLLSTQGWDEHYLEPVYECPDCKDTGYVGTEKCHCLKSVPSSSSTNSRIWRRSWTRRISIISISPSIRMTW